MVTFEGGQGITFSQEMINSFDIMGFNCYSTSRGNIFCVHRERAAFSALAYDVLSFPMMIGVYMNPSPHSSTAAEDGARAQLKAQLHQ
eukprot:gene28163-37136_t